MAEYKGLSIVFEGDASSLSAALSTISARAQSAQGNLTGINKALRLDPSNPELYARKLANLSTASKATTDRVSSLSTATSTLTQRQAELTAKVRASGEGYNEARAKVAAYDERIRRFESSTGQSIGETAKLNTALGSQARALMELRGEYGQAVSDHDRYKSELEKVNQALERNRTDIATATAAQRDYERQVLQTTAAQATQSTAIGALSNSLSAGAGYLSSLGSTLSSLGGRLSVIQGIVAGTFGRQVLNEAVNFGNAVSQVSGYLGVSAARMEGLRQVALQTGYETQYSATEAANAMSALAKGGLSEAEIEAGALSATIKLAAAGQMDLANAADITIQTMKSFGLASSDANEIADALAGAANASTAEVSDLSSAFSNCSAVCSAAGWSVQETAGAIGLLTDRGLSGEQAGTALKVMMQRLQSPTDKASEVMKKYGLEVRDADGNMKSATEIVTELTTKLGKLDAKSRDNALQTLFGTRSSNAALIFMQNGTEELEKYIDAASESGAASKMAKAQMGELGWALEYLSGEFETAQANLGSALTPALAKLAGAAEDALSAFNKLSPAAQSVIGKAALAAAALGPVLLAGGKVVSMLGSVGGSISRALTFVTAFGSTAKTGAALADRLAVAMSSASGGALSTTAAMGKLAGAMAALPTAAVAAGVVALGAGFAYAFSQAAILDENMNRVRDASEDLDEAIASVNETTDDTTTVASDAATALETMTSSWKTYASTVKENKDSTQAEISSLSDALYVIQRYADQTGLSVGQQRELASAIDTVNQSCGTNYEVFDAANGKIREQGTDAEVTAAQLQKLIDQQIYLSKVEQLSKDLSAAESNYGTQVEALSAAQEKYTKALKERNRVQKELNENKDTIEGQKLGQELLTAQSALDSATEGLKEAKKSAGEAADEVDRINTQLETTEEVGTKATKSLLDFVDVNDILGAGGRAGWAEEMREDFAKQWEAMGGDLDSFKGLSSRDLLEIVEAYDGTAESLATALANMAGGAHDTLAKWAEDNGADAEAVGVGLGDGLETGLINLDSSAEEINAYLDKTLGGGGEKATEKGNEAGESYKRGVAAGISSDTSSVSSAASGLLSSAKSGATDNGGMAIIGSGYASSLASGISGGTAGVSNASYALAGAAKSPITNLNSYKWGQDFSSSFASGMTSMIGSITSAAEKIAAKVKERVGHSTPAKGPLHGDDKWGLHLAQNFADGMRKGLPLVSSASLAMANAVNEPTMDWGQGLASGYPTTSDARGTTVNLYVDGARVNDDAAIRTGFIDMMYELYRREGGYCG